MAIDPVYRSLVLLQRDALRRGLYAASVAYGFAALRIGIAAYLEQQNDTASLRKSPQG